MKSNDALTSALLPQISHLMLPELATQDLFCIFISVCEVSSQLPTVPCGCLGTITLTEAAGMGASDLVWRVGLWASPEQDFFSKPLVVQDCSRLQ